MTMELQTDKNILSDDVFSEANASRNNFGS
jgi:hypothetical protein